MSLFAYGEIFTHYAVTITSTGLAETGYALKTGEKELLSQCSLGGRIMPRIKITNYTGSGSLTLLGLSYSVDGGTRYTTGQAMSVAVSGTGLLGGPATEVVCMIPKDVTHIRWDAGTETLGTDDYVTATLSLVCAI
jgi:hypothetical protein